MTCHRIAFASSIAHCGLLRNCVRAFGRLEGYGESFQSELELTVHEAFINAVRHGNGSDPGLPVTITMKAGGMPDSSALLVEVADCGAGFSLDGRTDFGDASGAAALSGRGLPLIAHFADAVRVERRPGGSVLLLRYIPY